MECIRNKGSNDVDEGMESIRYQFAMGWAESGTNLLCPRERCLHAPDSINVIIMKQIKPALAETGTWKTQCSFSRGTTLEVSCAFPIVGHCCMCKLFSLLNLGFGKDSASMRLAGFPNSEELHLILIDHIWETYGWSGPKVLALLHWKTFRDHPLTWELGPGSCAHH